MPQKDRNLLHQEIDQNINTNGVNEITGAILNETLKDLIDSAPNFLSDGSTASSGDSIYTADGSLQANRAVNLNGNRLKFINNAQDILFINANGTVDVVANGSFASNSSLNVWNFGGLKKMFDIDGLGHINVRINRTFDQKLIMGGFNTDIAGDWGSYDKTVVLGFNNITNSWQEVITGSNNNQNFDSQLIFQSIYYGNNNNNGGIKIGINNKGLGQAFGYNNNISGFQTFAFGMNNEVSEMNGYPQLPCHVIGSFVRIPNSHTVNECVFFGANESLDDPKMALQRSNLLLGVLPWEVDYDILADRTILLKMGEEPTTLPDNSCGITFVQTPNGRALRIKPFQGNKIDLFTQNLDVNPTNSDIAKFLSNLGLANLI